MRPEAHNAETGCRYCAALVADNERLRSENVSLREEIERLLAANALLREKLSENSHNSSKPPSRDPVSQPRHPGRRHKRSEGKKARKTGGQPGHRGTYRELIDTPDRVHEVDALCCERCKGRHLTRTTCAPRRHQVVEIPPRKANVDEWRRYENECLDCGHRTLADLPDGVSPGGFGPELQATVVYLTGPLRISRRGAQCAIEDLFGIHLSLGSMTAIETSASAVLEQPVEEAHRAAVAQPVAHLDETGWRHHHHKAWLWVLVTSVATIFSLSMSRGHDAFEKLIRNFDGILESDRWVIYDAWEVTKRQLCWSHLERTWERFVERGGEAARVGRELLDSTHQMFHWWHKVRDGTMTRESFRRHMGPIRTAIQQSLDSGMAVRSDAKTPRTCRRIRKLDAAMWTFVEVEGIEPTNNVAERAVRKGVLWRMTSLGTQSLTGRQFAERIMTATATVRQHGGNIYDYLVEAMTNRLHGHPAPSLLRAITHRKPDTQAA